MTARARQWRAVRHPLKICLRFGWRMGRGCLISPRGTIFLTKPARAGMFARKRTDFQLSDN